jgi:murein DD-endopeptidase MepM/ murein hydrolase activator NlpD
VKRTRDRGAGSHLGIVALAFVAGMLVDWWLRAYGPPLPRSSPIERPATAAASESATSAIATTGTRHRNTGDPEPAEVIRPERPARLHLPIDGISVESLKGGFAEARTGHPHEAVDILSPRNTAVHAVADGTIAKLFKSKAGGNTIYEFDPSGRYAYYYAHLERYEAGIREGGAIKRGQVIGYVGTSGNAPPDTPHLHFAVFELGPEHQWWKGKAVDPYPLFR